MVGFGVSGQLLVVGEVKHRSLLSHNTLGDTSFPLLSFCHPSKYIRLALNKRLLLFFNFPKVRKTSLNWPLKFYCQE